MAQWISMEETKRMMGILVTDDVFVVNGLIRDFFSVISFAYELELEEEDSLLILWNEFVEPNKDIIRLQGLRELYKWFSEEMEF